VEKYVNTDQTPESRLIRQKTAISNS